MQIWIRRIWRAVEADYLVSANLQAGELIGVGTIAGILKIDLIWMSSHAPHDEGDIRIAEIALLLRDFVEVRLVREIAHGLSRLDWVEKMGVGKKFPPKGGTGKPRANAGFSVWVHIAPPPPETS